MNTRKILNKSTFLKLPPEYQYKLSLLLPAVDRHGGKVNYSSFNNEFFARACEEWQERLFSGDFTPENLTKAKADIESDKLETDPWKVQNFEPVWGIKKGFDQDQKEENTEIVETIFTDKNEAALLIQSTFRGFKQRKEYLSLYGKIVLLQSMTRKILAKKRVNSIKKLKAEMEQAEQAAIIIQRCFRSFKVFRDMQRNQEALVWMARLKLAREEERRKNVVASPNFEIEVELKKVGKNGGKKRRHSNDKENGDTEEQIESNDDIKMFKGAKKSKLDKEDIQDAPCKFDWTGCVTRILVKKGAIKLAKLKKKVINEYRSTYPDSVKTRLELEAKLEKKVKKNKKFKISNGVKIHEKWISL